MEIDSVAVVLDVPFRREAEVLTTLSKLRLDPQTATITVVVCTTAPRSLQGLEAREA
jgi:hypothetical protein